MRPWSDAVGPSVAVSPKLRHNFHLSGAPVMQHRLALPCASYLRKVAGEYVNKDSLTADDVERTGKLVGCFVLLFLDLQITISDDCLENVSDNAR